jgi:hypothetical protein
MSTSPNIDRALEQRMSALRKANHVRSAASRAKQRMRVGAMSIAEGVADPHCGAMTVWQLMLSQPAWGASKAGRLLSRAGISPNRRVSDLTARHRDLLIAAVEERRARSAA